MFWQNELDRNLYGGCVMKIAPALDKVSKIQWMHINIDSFFPVWDPDNEDELLEVYVVTNMSSDQAQLRYGYKSEKEYVQRVEHWTKAIYENTLDSIRMDAYSGTNPWGVVPFVYIPRMRSTYWWGESLAEDIIPVQDELNMRLADLGEAVNYNTHPTRWGYNLPRSFNTKNFPLGSNVLWDLGRVVGQSPEPKVGILEASNPIPTGTFEYVKWLYDWSRTSAFAPPIAFGEDSGGGQRSGATLEIRMWPLVKAVRRSRSYLNTGLLRAVYITGLILKQKGLAPVRTVQALIEGRVVPSYAPVMPRDQAAIVDEVTKRLSTNPPTISLETAVNYQGQGIAEVNRIKKMLEDRAVQEQAKADQQHAQAMDLLKANGPSTTPKVA